MMTHLRIIGDVHQHWERYHRLLRKAHFTIQVGDFGFNYSTLLNVNAVRHRFLGGNHDNYDKVGMCPHYLGDYGLHSIPDFGDVFFVRGAFSIDQQNGGRDGGRRIEGVDWWPAEELHMADCYAALEEYSGIKPDFVVTHECPVSVVPRVTKSSRILPSRTNQLLQRMFEIHKPKTWVFGHYHKSWSGIINGTRFVCLDELECMDLPASSENV